MSFFDPQNIPGPQAIKTVSASQVKTFTLCERKWVLENVHKLRAPAGSALLMGTAQHKQIEDYFIHGKTPDAFLARAAIPHLPSRLSPGLGIEAPLDPPPLYAAGLQWKGFIDLLWCPDGVNTTEVSIYDHKTTKNMSWAKSPKELQTDIQLISYAKWASIAFPSAQKFNLQHTYLVTTTKDKVEPVATSVDREHVEECWTDLERMAGEMKALSDAKITWELATPNWESCGAFGGCPFRDLCNKNREASGGSIFTGYKPKTLNGANMSNAAELMKQMLAKKEAARAAAPAVTVNTPPVAQSVGATGVLPPDAPVQSKAIVEASLKAAAEAVVAEDKPKRGRPSKIKGVDDLANEAKADPVASTPATNPVIESPKARAEDLAKDLPKAVGFTLCLHCMPFSDGTKKIVALENVLHFLSEKIAKQTNVANLHVHDYSQKAKLLTEALKAATLDADTYTFTTNDGFSESIIMGALANKAHTIIRGMR